MDRPRPSAPPAVRWIARTLEEAGHETWAVGGAVRDVLMGRPSGDWDLATHATHLHVLCRGCGWVGEAPLTDADELVARLEERFGFSADVGHAAVHGLCRDCREELAGWTTELRRELHGKALKKNSVSLQLNFLDGHIIEPHLTRVVAEEAVDCQGPDGLLG